MFLTSVFFEHFEEDRRAFTENRVYPKYRHYSAHDTTVATLMEGLGIDLREDEKWAKAGLPEGEIAPIRYPLYCGSFAIELFVDDEHTLENPGVRAVSCLDVPVSEDLVWREEAVVGVSKEEMTVATFQARWADVWTHVQNKTFLSEVCGNEKAGKSKWSEDGDSRGVFQRKN
ncbi:hypothetical protein BLNAU_18495 [Blattamonas nauphoetae]|uniref:Uncharacterized protein n=1 Tax=Blattamonas nauphoetae TaxID=2049346 RepID=A0ABQ9X4G9_9EUKA|nr:hypothetical protein BLNAU_18495 [Blattamonas nauphoetae]